MSFVARRCAFCSRTIPDDELWKHLEDNHDNLKTLSFVVGGQSLDFQGYCNTFEECAYEPTAKDLQLDIPPKPVDVFFDLALSHDEMRNAPHDNIGDSGSFSVSEWGVLLAAVSRLGGTGFKLNRNRFITSLIRFLLTHDASPLVDDAGSVVLFSEAKGDSTGYEGSVSTEEVSWSKVLAAWIDALGPKSRVATFRRAARSLGPSMMTQIKTSNSLKDLLKNGTPLSQKFSIPNNLYYTAVSFFPAIKDPGSWTPEERRFSAFRVRSTVVESAVPRPFDNRPGLGSPESEHTLGAKVVRDHQQMNEKKFPDGVTTRDLMMHYRGKPIEFKSNGGE